MDSNQRPAQERGRPPKTKYYVILMILFTGFIDLLFVSANRIQSAYPNLYGDDFPRSNQVGLTPSLKRSLWIVYSYVVWSIAIIAIWSVLLERLKRRRLVHTFATTFCAILFFATIQLGFYCFIQCQRTKMTSSVSSHLSTLRLTDYQLLNYLLEAFAVSSGTLIPCFSYLSSAVTRGSSEIGWAIRYLLPYVTKRWNFGRSERGKLFAIYSFWFISWYILLGFFIAFASNEMLQYTELLGHCKEGWDCYLILPSSNGQFEVNCTEVQHDSWLECFKLGTAADQFSLQLLANPSVAVSTVWVTISIFILTIITMILNKFGRTGRSKNVLSALLVLAGLLIAGNTLLRTGLNCTYGIHIFGSISARIQIFCAAMLCLAFGITTFFAVYQTQETERPREADNSVMGTSEGDPRLGQGNGEIGPCHKALIFLLAATVFYLPVLVMAAISFACKPF